MTDALPFKPEKPVEKGTDPGEKALKKLEKLEAETGLLGPADRYKAQINAVTAIYSDNSRPVQSLNGRNVVITPVTP